MLGALACGTAQAQWKWRDARGQMHTSDLPPPLNVAEKDILDRPADFRRRAPPADKAASAPVPTASASSNQPRTDPELDARRQRAAAEQTAQLRQQEQANAAVRAENCGRARSALAGLESGQRLTRTNAQGEREVLDDKGRADEMMRARAVIASDCR